jgi:hypothetical protein
MYELNPETVVHETDIFAVDVGSFPNEELPCYRAWNKRTGVLEYAHSISFYAMQWADAATKILQGEEQGATTLPEVN